MMIETVTETILKEPLQIVVLVFTDFHQKSATAVLMQTAMVGKTD